MSTVEELAARMAEQHRPVVEPAGSGFNPGTLTVHCAACDGNRRKIRAAEDLPVECDMWRAAVALGLVRP